MFCSVSGPLFNRRMHDTTPDDRCRHLAREQYGVISRSQARECGMTSRQISTRVSSGHWEKHHSHILRLGADGDSWRQRVMVATMSYEGAVAARRTAALLHGLDGVSGREIEVVSAVSRARRPTSFTVHRTNWLPDTDVTVVNGIPVTTPARTLLDLGGAVGIPAVRRALESALAKGLVTLPQLVEQLRVSGKMGRPGTAALRELLEEYGPDSPVSESDLEHRMFEVIAEAGLPAPRRQLEVWDDGAFLGRLDGAYPELRIALEADGYEFHSAPSGRRDRWRQNAFTGRTWLMLRFTSHDAARPRVFVADLRRAFEARSRGP
jgi:hypothetical protein